MAFLPLAPSTMSYFSAISQTLIPRVYELISVVNAMFIETHIYLALVIQLSLTTRITCVLIVLLLLFFLPFSLLSTWHKMELSEKRVPKANLMGAFSWLMVHVEETSPLKMMSLQGTWYCVIEESRIQYHSENMVSSARISKYHCQFGATVIKVFTNELPAFGLGSSKSLWIEAGCWLWEWDLVHFPSDNRALMYALLAFIKFSALTLHVGRHLETQC